MATQEDRRRAVSVSETILSKIKTEFPELKPYLVFSSVGGQAPVTSTLSQILLDYPTMCVDTPEVREAERLVRAMEKLKDDHRLSPSQEQQRKQMERRLKSLEGDIVFQDDVRVELRFEALKFEQIRALQKHHLVDRDLTPESRASIRIVLGTLKALSDRAASV